MTSLQQDIFQGQEFNFDLSDAELSKFVKSSKTRSNDIQGALGRLMQAKRYHEVANKLSQELLLARIEIDKLNNKIRILEKAN